MNSTGQMTVLIYAIVIAIETLCTSTDHSYREPEVGVKFCINNFSKLVYCKVFL